MVSKIEIVQINDKTSIHFIHIPEGSKLSKVSLDNHQTIIVGRLKSFNRVKLLSDWKKDNPDLVKAFTDVLNSRTWDFEKFPNPVAYICYYLDNSK